MQRFATLVFAFTAACASSSSDRPTAEPTRSTTSITSTGATSVAGNNTTTLTLSRDTRGTVNMVAAPPEEVWAALPGVFRELDIPIGTLDAERRVLGNAEFQAARKLAGEALSTWVRCGNDAFGRPLANSHRLTLSLLTYLSPGESTGTIMETRLEASAADPGQSTAPVECTSTGKLEERITQGVRNRISS